MIHKTRGIVFRFTRFRETSIIVNIFTELFGLQSYMVNGVRSNTKTSGSKMALYQPLTLLDLVVYHRPHANINRIKEIKCIHPCHSIGADIHKGTIGVFINEIINKTVREESHAEEIFNFLLHSLLTLDHLDSGYENFHLVFLLKLSSYLGFGTRDAHEIAGLRLTDPADVQALEEVLRAEYTSSLAISTSQRRAVLECLLKFYSEHIDTMGEIKSVQVLRDVLS